MISRTYVKRLLEEHKTITLLKGDGDRAAVLSCNKCGVLSNPSGCDVYLLCASLEDGQVKFMEMKSNRDFYREVIKGDPSTGTKGLQQRLDEALAELNEIRVILMDQYGDTI